MPEAHRDAEAGNAKLSLVTRLCLEMFRLPLKVRKQSLTQKSRLLSKQR